jgi:tetratricopeptide (TPR) repeat protein
MRESPTQFAEALSSAIQRAKAIEGKSIAIIQDELGYAIGREGRTAIEYYRKGHVPPQLVVVETLARELVQRARLEEQWLSDFLRYAGHPAPNQLVNELFPALSATTELSHNPPHELSTVEPPFHSMILPVGQLPPPSPLPSGSVMPLSRNPHFVGREQDLLRLAHAFNTGQTAAVSQVGTAAATGLGGMGKTQLASEFVHRYGQFFPGGVFWLSFENPQAVPAEIAYCGGPGAMELRPDFTTRLQEEQVRLVQAAWQESTPRLLVFDNCEDPTLLARWRPTGGGCRVLVTSRRGEWDPILNVEVLPLGVLGRAESVELLRRHVPYAEVDLLDAIAAELGDLPLALHLAGSYLYRYRRAISPAQYLAQLQDPLLLQHPSFLEISSSTLSPTEHVQHVGRTFALSFDRLKPADDRDALARRLLVHMAHFAPGEPVWYDILVRTLDLEPTQPNDAVRAEDAFARLIELGLIQVEDEKGMRVHRLLAAFVQETLVDEAALGQRKIEEEIYANLRRANDEGAPLTLLPGALHMRYVVEAAAARDPLWGAEMATALGRHLWHTGDYEGARQHYLQALAVRRQHLGEEHPDTADSYNNIGMLLRDLGDFSGCRANLEQALALRLKLLGESHADTADTISELGVLCWTERRNEEAVAHFMRALAICEQVLGMDHPATAEVANNLGVLYKEGLDDPARARPYLEQALRVRRATLGEQHPYTALVHHNLGFVLEDLDDWQAARRAYEQALDIRRTTLGIDHPDTAHTMSMLGDLLVRHGEVSSGHAYIEQALASSLRVVGEQHLLTAVCHTYLGECLWTQGELAEAREHLAKATAIRETLYRNDHPKLAHTLDAQGMIAYAQGQLSLAQDEVERALAMRRRLLGEAHPDTVASRKHLAMIEQAKNKG